MQAASSIESPGGSGSFSGNLDLNGFTLTKLGAGTNSIVDANVLNAGVVNLAGGTLTITYSLTGGTATCRRRGSTAPA